MDNSILIDAKFKRDNNIIIICSILCLLSIILCVLASENIIFEFWQLIIFVPNAIMFLFTILNSINATKQKLTITKDNIYGCTTKEEFNFPIDNITSVTLEKTNTLVIYIQSKKFKFYSFANANEVYNTLIELTKNKSINENTELISNTKAIKAYKELLDIGAISQEEFDKKKNELLNS